MSWTQPQRGVNQYHHAKRDGIIKLIYKPQRGEIWIIPRVEMTPKRVEELKETLFIINLKSGQPKGDLALINEKPHALSSANTSSKAQSLF